MPARWSGMVRTRSSDSRITESRMTERHPAPLASPEKGGNSLTSKSHHASMSTLGQLQAEDRYRWPLRGSGYGWSFSLGPAPSKPGSLMHKDYGFRLC